MNIGEAARASTVPAKMIRYYEQIGLAQLVERTDGNYRSFGPREINELRFIKRARNLGFSVQQIRSLLALWRDRSRPDGEVKTVADRHLADLQDRLAEMQAIAGALRALSARCADGNRPDFPVLPDAPSSSAPSTPKSP